MNKRRVLKYAGGAVAALVLLDLLAAAATVYFGAEIAQMVKK